MTLDSFRRYAITVALCLCISIFTTALGQNASAFSLLLYAQTGQMPTTAPTEYSTDPTERTQPPTTAETVPEAVVLFSPEDLTQVSFLTDVSADPEILLCAPLDLDLSGPEPRVLILHTHTTEAYADTYDRENFRTHEETGNMLAVGDELARVLELGGISVIHDRTVHDYPNYNGSYAAARDTVQAWLKEYPSIRLVLDLHRDAAAGDTPFVTQATVNGQSCAQISMVMGAGFAGWEENFTLALKLSALLERENPGITRPISVRNKVYNLDLCPGSLLIEVGATGNTKAEALIAVNALARAILELAQ